MKRRSFIQLGAASALAGSVKAQTEAAPAVVKTQPHPAENPFLLAEGNWYKAALHVHTTTSDGDVDVDTRIKQYRDLHYDVVAVTDHWKTNDLSGYSDDKFLAINSMEAHPKTGTGAPAHHLVCLDLPHPFTLERDLKAQELIDKVRDAGGKVIYAHPYWTDHSIEEMRSVTGFIGIEIYNAICELNCAKGHGHVHADHAFNRIGLFGLVSVDDVHKTHQINNGWTMIRAKELTKPAIMAAIEAGHYYASNGPSISDFRIEEGKASIKCSEASRISFFFNSTGGGKNFDAKPGESLTEMTWNFANARRKPKWIRAQVTDASGKNAWTSPYFV